MWPLPHFTHLIITMDKDEKRNRITRQHMTLNVYKAFERLSKERPDFDIKVAILSGADDLSPLYLVEISAYNCGKNLYIQRIIAFTILAMKDYYND